jgi:hypothetical protein
MNHDKEENIGRWPDFFLIGAAKSGTSSLFGYLNRHPDIYIPSIKEPEYFSRQSVYARGEKWYKNLFTGAEENQMCGDASTTYSRWPHTLDSPKLIAKLLPRAKFIYIMRHPIDRMYSHYAHHMRFGINMSFEEALKKNQIYFSCSLYMYQIERYLRFFSNKSFLFLFQSDLRANPRKVLKDITDFLELRNVDLLKEGHLAKNVSGPDHYIRSKTTGKLRKIPGIVLIADTLPKAMKDSLFGLLKKSFIGKRLAAQSQLIPMRPETRDHLIDELEEPNRMLEDFLGIELPTWRI